VLARLASLVIAIYATIACSSPTFTNMAASPDTCRPEPGMSWRTLPPVVDRAAVITRGTVTRLGSIDIAGTPVRTIALQPSEILKGTAGAEITIIEYRCRFFDVREGDEWIAFLSPYATSFSPPYKIAQTAAVAGAYLTLAGPETTFAVRGGMLAKAGSLDEMPAQIVRAYEGKPAAQLLKDIRAIRPVDGDVRDLFARFGWAPRATLYAGELTLPPAIGFQNLWLLAPGTPTKVNHNFDEFAKVSAQAGLDFRPYASKPGELVQILLERDWDGVGRFPPLGHAVLVDRRIVGAWVHIAPQGDLYAITQRDAAVAAPPHDPPAPAPIPDRFPQGVNMTRDHGLAQTSSLAVKTASLAGGQTQDRTVIGPIVEALDVMLPTQAVPTPPGGQPMIVLIRAEDRYFTLEYWADLDLLVNRNFGYAVHPPRRAIELLEAVR
jgi:hypothetical protein